MDEPLQTNAVVRYSFDLVPGCYRLGTTLQTSCAYVLAQGHHLNIAASLDLYSLALASSLTTQTRWTRSIFVSAARNSRWCVTGLSRNTSSCMSRLLSPRTSFCIYLACCFMRCLHVFPSFLSISLLSLFSLFLFLFLSLSCLSSHSFCLCLAYFSFISLSLSLPRCRFGCSLLL